MRNENLGVGHTNALPETIVQAAPPPGIKSQISLLPGVLTVHRLTKNLRYWIDSRRGTTGGIKRAHMSPDSAVDYTESIFKKIDLFVRRQGGWAQKRVLEIGPGDSLGTGLWCLGAGAESYTAIDRFAVDLDLNFESRVYSAIKNRVGAEGRGSLSASPVSEICLGDLPGSLQYHNDVPIESAPDKLGRGVFDVIFSNAVLEHVRDIEETMYSLRELLVCDGIMFHDVDLRSHQTYEKHPIEFLEHPRFLWDLMSSHNGEPNRARLPKYLEILNELGFQSIEMGVTKIFDENLVSTKRHKLAREFRTLSVDELKPAVFWFCCKKPKGTEHLEID
jgi:SAM-dependent methyltransferase